MDMQRDILSQEITILQVMNFKDLSQYLQYCNQGFMCFADISLIAKERIHTNILEQDGSDAIKVRR